MSSRRARILIQDLEPRILFAVDGGGFLTALPPLSNNSSSQTGSIAAVQLQANEGPAEALSIQSGSSLDLTATRPTAFLAEQFVAQATALPALLPDSMVAAPPVA